MSSIARRLFSSRPLRSGKLTFTRYLSKCCQLFRSHPKPNTLNWQVKSTVVKTPVFRSEAEEAEWWDRHQDLIADLLLKHGRRGAVPPRACLSVCPSPTSRVPASWLRNAASATRPLLRLCSTRPSRRNPRSPRPGFPRVAFTSSSTIKVSPWAPPALI